MALTPKQLNPFTEENYPLTIGLIIGAYMISVIAMTVYFS